MTDNIGAALAELDAVTLRRIRTATLFLRHMRTLAPFGQFSQARSLKADMDAADDAWHAAYQDVEDMMTAEQYHG